MRKPVSIVAAVLVCALGGNAVAQERGKLTPLPDELPPSPEARPNGMD
jgi:hypothetical protein